MSLDVQTKVDGGVMNITCNAEGYTPEEISVTVEGDELVVKAEHKSDASGQKVHKSFSRRIGMPRDVIKSSIRCDFDRGQLVVHANLPQPKPAEPFRSPKCVTIPISFK